MKKNKKISYGNSSYLFYVFWIIRDFHFKNERRKKGESGRVLDYKQILEKLNTVGPTKKWTQSTIYEVINFLAKEKIIETQKQANRVFVVGVLDHRQYYVPKKLLDMYSSFKELVPANYLRVYQYLKNLAIKNYKRGNKNKDTFISQNSYKYFEDLNITRHTVARIIKGIIENNVQFEYDNKILSSKLVQSVVLDRNTYYKGVEYQQEQITIQLQKTEKKLYGETTNKKTKFGSSVLFEGKVVTTVNTKLKKFFEYKIKRSCYLLVKTKYGLGYMPCGCDNRSNHYGYDNTPHKPFQQDRRLVIGIGKSRMNDPGAVLSPWFKNKYTMKKYLHYYNYNKFKKI